jgi:hypothetical protein
VAARKADRDVFLTSLIRVPEWMTAECMQAGIPASERTVGRLIVHLGGRVTEWRKAVLGMLIRAPETLAATHRDA